MHSLTEFLSFTGVIGVYGVISHQIASLNIILTLGSSQMSLYMSNIHVYEVVNNNKKFRSFKRKENIHKKEVGPYRGFGY